MEKANFGEPDKNIKNDKLKKKLDLMLLSKIWEDNTLFFNTDMDYQYFDDVLVRVLWKLTAKNINNKGRFFPINDLEELVEDSERMEKYREVGYPLEINSEKDIIEYLDKYKTDRSLKSLEKTIKDRWIRKQLKKFKIKLGEDITDSNVSSREILRRYSTRMDNLLYDDDQDRIVLSSQEMYEDELAYQNSEGVDEFYLTGNSLIDQMNGGLNAPSFTCIAGEPKAGKSMALYQIALGCLLEGKSVVFGTIEIPPAEAKRKIYSLYTQMQYRKINKKVWESDEEKKRYLEKVAEFTDRFADKLFIYYKKSGFSSKDIENYTMNLEKGGIVIENIILDYMLIMRSSDDIKGVGGVEYMYKIPKELRILSQKTNTRVFSAAQLHSRTKTKRIEEITANDVYYMKNVAHEATYLLALKRDEGKDILYSKVILARQEWSPEVYVYPQYDYSRIYTGDAVPFDEAQFTDWGD